MKIFNIFFSLLNESGIEYAIAGDTTEYPNKITGDIDIIVSNSDLKKMWKLMLNFSNKDLFWVQNISHEITSYYCIVSLSIGSSHQVIKPDIGTDFYRSGKLFLGSSFLLDDKIYNQKGFYELSHSKNFIYYFLKKIDKENIDRKEFDFILLNWYKNKFDCIQILKKYFSSKSILLIEKSLDERDIKLLTNNINFLKKELLYKLKTKIFDYFRILSNRFKRIINPTGLVVVFMGPDGCGKTTIINSLSQNVLKAFRRHDNYHLFPIQKRTSLDPKIPHGKPSRGYFLSIVKLLYILSIYIYGYMKNIFPLKIKSTLIIFDRYFHDHLIDKKRYRYGSTDFWIYFISYLIPKPDLWILLDAPSNVIRQRKKELSLNEISIQLKKYHLFFNNLNNAHIVNSNQSIEQVVYEVEKIIFNKLNERLVGRYKR